MPLAAYALFVGGALHIRAAWGDPEGAVPLVHAQAQAVVADAQAAVVLGERVARQLQASVDAQAARKG